MNRCFLFSALLTLCSLRFCVGINFAADAPSPAAIAQDMRSFATLGSVLYVAAHPDDENTQLITYLARGRGYRMAYLSLTRGDGGQNLLGPEFGDELGVIRTQELLAARRLDGGRQYFTRAKDFGYSKDYRQTLTKWDHQQVLSDIVRVIREFRPDVIITRFSTIPSNTHGHHTASAILALEAFKVCDDPKLLPELTPYQPKRIFMNGLGTGFRRADQLVPGANAKVDNVRINIGGDDPVLNIPFSQIASRSRAMHKTQGFGNFGGGGAGGGPHYEAFQLLDGDPATKDILDGIDTTWNRYPGGAQIASQTDDLIKNFNPQDPSASAPAILKIRLLLAALPANPSDSLLEDKRHQLDGILQNCLGLEIQSTIPHAEVVPGEELKLHHTAIIHSSIPVIWTGVHYPITTQTIATPINLQPNQSAAIDATPILPPNTPISQKYWLREDSTPGMFRVDDPSLIGRPENPPAFPVELIFQIAGQTLTIPDEPVAAAHRRVDVIPPVALHLPADVVLFPPGASRTVQVEVTAYRAGTTGTLQLTAPTGWTITPPTQPIKLTNVNDRALFTFNVTAPPAPQSAQITAVATIGAHQYTTQRVEISYAHIPIQLLQPPARFKAVCLDLAIGGKTVAYLPGAGDNVADAIAQMGYTVTPITGDDLTTDKLKSFDAVVFGVRAFNVRHDIAPHLAALFDFIKSGGNVIVQYNRPDGLQDAQLGPYDLTLARDLPHYRVTDEKAPVTLLAPNHPAFNTPNKITPTDFDGWIQERGLVFPATWDTDHYTALLACSDPGEAPLKSAILVAHLGKGYFVYTGLSWFRQLPAGVPGAYRLFANLISLGK